MAGLAHSLAVDGGRWGCGDDLLRWAAGGHRWRRLTGRIAAVSVSTRGPGGGRWEAERPSRRPASAHSYTLLLLRLLIALCKQHSQAQVVWVAHLGAAVSWCVARFSSSVAPGCGRRRQKSGRRGGDDGGGGLSGNGIGRDGAAGASASAGAAGCARHHAHGVGSALPRAAVGGGAARLAHSLAGGGRGRGDDLLWWGGGRGRRWCLNRSNPAVRAPGDKGEAGGRQP